MKKKIYQRFCINCGCVQIKDICKKCGRTNLPEAVFHDGKFISEKAQKLELRNYQ